jgi:hypothetical protein
VCCARQPFLHLTCLFFLCGGSQESKSEWLGDRHQGPSVQGIKWDRRAAPRHRAPSPGYSTGLMEPCGAFPRKCLLFILLCDAARGSIVTSTTVVTRTVSLGRSVESAICAIRHDLSGASAASDPATGREKIDLGIGDLWRGRNVRNGRSSGKRMHFN